LAHTAYEHGRDFSLDVIRLADMAESVTGGHFFLPAIQKLFSIYVIAAAVLLGVVGVQHSKLI
jgi:hypothetical protein